ncbi:MAG: uroporphyrinogen decarboxylase family protein [Oscillospiraceae bacterium]
MQIQRWEGTMTPKERVLLAMNREIPDRVPINYMTNPTVHGKLAAALGIDPGDYEGVLEALGVDFRGAHPPYIGPALFPDPGPERQVDPVYGFVTRWVENSDGGYWDFCDFPLQGADPETVAAFPVPNPDDYDYDRAIEALRHYDGKGYAAHIGNAGITDIINSTGRVMGMEDTLMNLLTGDEATLTYIDRTLDMELQVMSRLLEKAKDSISFLWLGEDLGTQHTPMISLELYREVLRPRHERFVDLGKAYDKPVMIHSCGSSSWAYNDFIEMGISVVDTLQPEAANMSPEYLKATYGDRLAFHGCISTAGPLAYGTPEEVVETVRHTLEVMMPGGGYMLSPTHAIQDNTPVENIVAMYNAAHRYGRY